MSLLHRVKRAIRAAAERTSRELAGLRTSASD